MSAVSLFWRGFTDMGALYTARNRGRLHAAARVHCVPEQRIPDKGKTYYKHKVIATRSNFNDRVTQIRHCFCSIREPLLAMKHIKMIDEHDKRS